MSNTIEIQPPRDDDQLMRDRELILSIPPETLGQQLGLVANELTRPVKVGVAGVATAGTLLSSGVLDAAPVGASEVPIASIQASPAPISPAAPQMPTYATEQSTVNPGDSYWRIISRDTNLPDSWIAGAIPVVKDVNSQSENHVLHPGDKLYVKFLNALGMQAPVTATTNVETSVNYTVQDNDTAWDIANRFGVPLEKLVADNQLADPSLIHPGQQFVIKKSQPVAPVPPTPPPQPPTKPDYYQDVVSGKTGAGVVVVPKGTSGQEVWDAAAEVTGIPAEELSAGAEKINEFDSDRVTKHSRALVIPGLSPDMTDEVTAKIIEDHLPKPPATSTTTKPAPTTTSTTEAPTTTTSKPAEHHQDTPPMPKGKSMEFQNKQGLSIDQLADVVGGIHGVSPETAKQWLEQANKDRSSKITLPGVSKAEWEKAWDDITKMAAVIKLNEALAAQVEAPGLKRPPGMQQLSQNYWLLPKAPNGEYTTATNNSIVYSGSKALVEGVYTWSSDWAAEHPDAKIIVGDMNAADGHASHENGVDVDLTVQGGKAANMYTGSHDMNVGLGKTIIKSKIVKKIFFGDKEVIEEVNDWAASTGNGNSIMEYWPNHETHFHVRIADKFRLATVANAPAPLPPPPAPAPAPQPAPEAVNDPSKIELSHEESALIDTFNIAPDQKDFLKLVVPIARKIAIDEPINPAVWTAQIIGEAAWGRSAPGNNYFGMKVDDGWHGPRQLLDTFEDVNGQRVKTKAWFKVYASPEECFRDHTRLIATAQHYADARAAKDNWPAYLHALVNEGEPKYATAIDYEEVIGGLIKEFQLDKLTHTG